MGLISKASIAGVPAFVFSILIRRRCLFPTGDRFQRCECYSAEASKRVDIEKKAKKGWKIDNMKKVPFTLAEKSRTVSKHSSLPSSFSGRQSYTNGNGHKLPRRQFGGEVVQGRCVSEARP